MPPGRGLLIALSFDFANFVGGGLGVSGIRVAFSDRLRCRSGGGGALGTRMNLFDRLARVIKVFRVCFPEFSSSFRATLLSI